MRRGCRWVFLWGNSGNAHICRCVLEYVPELWTVKMSWYFSLEFDGGTDAGLWTLTSTTEKDRRRKKNVWHHYMDSCCRTRTMERKSQLKTIKSTSIFQLVWFHFLFSHRWRFWWRGTGEPHAAAAGTPWLLWGLAGGAEWQHVGPCHLWPSSSSSSSSVLSGTSDAAWGNQTGGVTAWGSQLSLERTILACWQIWWNHFLSQTEGL